MKIAKSVAILSIMWIFNMAHAGEITAGEEMAGDSDNVSAYCEEQVELAGIEDANEKKQYMQECIDSFAVQESDVQPAN